MRFRLTLTLDQSKPATLPVNYQYPLSAWMYRTIHEGNNEFADFLHKKGYEVGKKAFKFFTFSMLGFPEGGFRLSGDRLQMLSDSCTLEVSFLAPEAMQHFIGGLFGNQKCTIGDKKSRVSFKVTSVETSALPSFTRVMEFKTLSPVLVSMAEAGKHHAAYLAPDSPFYGKLLFDNLLAKYAAALQSGIIQPDGIVQQEEPDFRFTLLNEPRMKGLTIKQGTPFESKIIGYQYRFRVEAPLSLIRLGYLAGFGEKNSLGLGCCRVADNN